jgi:uncharacterized protein YggE
MRLSVSSAFAGVALCVASQAFAQTGTRPDAIAELNAVGRGEIRVTPDRATVLISVETHASNAAAASSANSDITASTIKAVKSAASSQDQVTTQSYSVTPDYQKGKPSGFGARNTIRVELHDISRLGPVIDAGLSSGATQVSQVQFTSSTTADARRKAMKLAVNEARLDAEAMAEAAGGTVGRLLALTSVSNGGIGTARLEAAVITSALSASGGNYTLPPIMPDELTIAATATAKWEFIPRRTP